MKPKPVIHPVAEHEIDITWAKTRAYMRADFSRNVANFGGHGSFFTRLVWRLMPNVLAVSLYRISRHLYLTGHGTAASLVALISLYLTRAELPPYSSIGPGFLIGHATGVTVIGRVGRNFTAYGVCGVGSGYGTEDIGGGPGRPVLGDNVTLAHFSLVQGAVRVGDNVSFGPHAHVTRDVPADTMVVGAPSRPQRRAATPLAAVGLVDGLEFRDPVVRRARGLMEVPVAAFVPGTEPGQPDGQGHPENLRADCKP